ncbi:MAG: PadR family transcriptional regulator [Actinobacteria bacterium]|jgi:DNA-binding PadR family transcriptional regulator|nr:MAG: PadR family transcriptional regulator [Actinomycetota bacterium]
MSRPASEEKKARKHVPGAIDHERFVREGPQKRFIEPRLLYLIKKAPSYGYQLSEDMGELPFPGPTPDSAAVYRMLRELEKNGLVRSQWQHGETGPSKRVYSLTAAGGERLEAWIDAFRGRVELLNAFIALCEEAG